MSETQGTDAVDFEHAQFDETASSGRTCQVCKQALDAEYFSVNGHAVCAGCLAQLRAGLAQGSFGKALGLGLLAGAAGAAVYYGIRALTGYDLALITVLLGTAVGIAVRRGAGASQKGVYRGLAVGLAWLSMCSAYVPEMVEGAEQSGPLVWVVMTVLATTVPFYMLKSVEVLGLLIFGFGLWEAWRRSAAAPFVVEGPFAIISPAAVAAEPRRA